MKKKNILYIVIPLLTIFISNYVTAQEVTLGTVKTDLKQNAISFGISYLKTLDSLWEKQDHLLSGEKSLFLITPDVNIQSGTNDAFSSVNAKITGLAMFFQTTNVAGQITPNTAKTFHTLPMSLGLETNNKFNVINGIFEIGYVPWYQAETREIPEWLKHSKIGFFVQGGYKFKVDSTGNTSVGGEIDQSKEKTDNAIFRLKGSFSIDTKPLKINSLKVGLVGKADGWYDILNKEVYYNLQAKFRIFLTDKNYFDFQYQKGSGAPNFNQGDQYGMGLTVNF
jgi:hypothetical protein